MPSAKVISKEQDLSTTIASFAGVYGAITINATKGPVGVPTLVTSDTDFLNKFTPDGKIAVGMDSGYFSALNFLGQSKTLWVTRAADTALYSGVSLKTFTSPYNDVALLSGLADPTAYLFDTGTDAPAVAEVTRFTFSQLGSFYDVVGSAKALQLFNSPAVGHYFWFNVVGGSNSQTDPALVGTGHQVDVLPADTAAQVATKFSAAVAAVSAAFTSSTFSAAVIDVTNVTAGTATDATAVGSAAAIVVQTQGAAAVNIVDESILIYASSPGVWGNKVGIIVTTYTADQVYVKEPGAFKIDVYKTSNLAVPVESWLCSRVQGAVDGYGNNIYVEDVLLGSNYIRAISNPAVAETILPKDQPTVLLMNGGSDGNAVTDSDIIDSMQPFRKKDCYPVTVMMDAGHASPAVQLEIDNIAQSRGDCVGIFSVPYSAESAADYISQISTYRTTDLNLNSSYSALYTPHINIFDRFNNRQVYVAPDGFVGAAISYSEQNFEIWYPPAGNTRGKISALGVRQPFDEGERDVLQDLQINPIRFTTGGGITIWGQKTLLSRPSSLQSLNVRLLLIVIEPAIATALEDFLFELNDSTTRLLATTRINTYMGNIQSRRGVYNFQVVCDDSNNSAADEAASRMNVDLYVQQEGDVEQIIFRTIITNSAITLQQ